MEVDYLLIAAIIPIVGLCYYIYKKDINREPGNVLATLFVLGFFSAIPVLFIELVLGRFFPTDGVEEFIPLFINTFISIALIEEGFKWIITKKLGYDNKEFDEVYDIIVYAVFASLGFACIENIFYVYSFGFLNAIFRGLLSIPGHTCFGVIMGYCLAQAKLHSLKKNSFSVRQFFVFSILFPALAHTIYDALLFYMSIGGFVYFWLFLLFYLVMVIICFKIVNNLSKIQKRLYDTRPVQTVPSFDIKFCPYCGKEQDHYDFCPFCGKKLTE